METYLFESSIIYIWLLQALTVWCFSVLQQELEEAASKPAIKKEEEEVIIPKHQSLAQKIYADNRVSMSL